MIEDIILLFFMIIFPLFWLRVIKKFDWKKIQKELIPVSKDIKKELIGSLKLFFALLISFILLSFILTLLGLNDLEKVSEVIALNMENAVLFIALMAVLVFFEEFFFRAFLVNRIGIIPSSLLFGLAHFGYASIAQIIGAFALGLLLAYWFKQNKSIVQNYFGHLLYNLFAIALYVLVG
jgi:membrane protease YdiL (CAAX protease family)